MSTHPDASRPLAVALECGPKRRVFAQARDWIGWCRAAKDEPSALAALLAASARYAAVARLAGEAFDAPATVEGFLVEERVVGTAVTDYGAPAALLEYDRAPLDDADVERLAQLLAACWHTFDEAYAAVSQILPAEKPARGRSLADMRLHLLEADRMHLAAFGHPFRSPDAATGEAFEEQQAETRQALLAGLRAAPRDEIPPPIRRYGFDWTPRFAVRRSAWHALDHAWELRDRMHA